jgi:hypothetical protein
VNQDIVSQGDFWDQVQTDLPGDAVHFGDPTGAVDLNEAHGDGEAHQFTPLIQAM